MAATKMKMKMAKFEEDGDLFDEADMPPPLNRREYRDFLKFDQALKDAQTDEKELLSKNVNLAAQIATGLTSSGGIRHVVRRLCVLSKSVSSRQETAVYTLDSILRHIARTADESHVERYERHLEGHLRNIFKRALKKDSTRMSLADKFMNKILPKWKEKGWFVEQLESVVEIVCRSAPKLKRHESLVLRPRTAAMTPGYPGAGEATPMVNAMQAQAPLLPYADAQDMTPALPGSMTPALPGSMTPALPGALAKAEFAGASMAVLSSIPGTPNVMSSIPATPYGGGIPGTPSGTLGNIPRTPGGPGGALPMTPAGALPMTPGGSLGAIPRTPVGAMPRTPGGAIPSTPGDAQGRAAPSTPRTVHAAGAVSGAAAPSTPSRFVQPFTPAAPGQAAPGTPAHVLAAQGGPVQPFTPRGPAPFTPAAGGGQPFTPGGAAMPFTPAGPPPATPAGSGAPFTPAGAMPFTPVGAMPFTPAGQPFTPAGGQPGTPGVVPFTPGYAPGTPGFVPVAGGDVAPKTPGTFGMAAGTPRGLMGPGTPGFVPVKGGDVAPMTPAAAGFRAGPGTPGFVSVKMGDVAPQTPAAPGLAWSPGTPGSPGPSMHPMGDSPGRPDSAAAPPTEPTEAATEVATDQPPGTVPSDMKRKAEEEAPGSAKRRSLLVKHEDGEMTPATERAETPALSHPRGEETPFLPPTHAATVPPTG